MSFQQLSNVPVRIVDTVIDVVPRGPGSQEHDDVFVTVTMDLLADIDSQQEAVLILPMSQEAQQQPVVRYTSDHITGKQVFEFDPVDRSDYDDEVVERLERLADGASKREQRDLAVAIKRAAQSFSTTVVKVEPGQRQLRLFYSIAADRVAEKEFEFSVIGPLPSFVIGTGGSIGVITLLPRNTTVVAADGLTDPNNPGSAIQRTDANLASRPALAWFWQNDPLFRVRYRYP
jgi:hypothetical protein